MNLSVVPSYSVWIWVMTMIIKLYKCGFHHITNSQLENCVLQKTIWMDDTSSSNIPSWASFNFPSCHEATVLTNMPPCCPQRYSLCMKKWFVRCYWHPPPNNVNLGNDPFFFLFHSNPIHYGTLILTIDLKFTLRLVSPIRSLGIVAAEILREQTLWVGKNKNLLVQRED